MNKNIKLQLNKQVIANLNKNEIKQVNGGRSTLGMACLPEPVTVITAVDCVETVDTVCEHTLGCSTTAPTGINCHVGPTINCGGGGTETGTLAGTLACNAYFDPS